MNFNLQNIGHKQLLNLYPVPVHSTSGTHRDIAKSFFELVQIGRFNSPNHFAVGTDVATTFSYETYRRTRSYQGVCNARAFGATAFSRV